MFINPLPAQLETVLLCGFLVVKDRTFDAFDDQPFFLSIKL